MRVNNKADFDQENVFGLGEANTAFARYFTGNSYLNPLTAPGECPIFMANVTFEPGCRNNWHIHHGKSGGGQILICTAGSGWYQEEGKAPVSLEPGTVINIPAEVKHCMALKQTAGFPTLPLRFLGKKPPMNGWKPWMMIPITG